MNNDKKLLEITENYKKRSNQRLQEISNINRKTNEIIEEKDKNKDMKDAESILETI